MKDVSQCLLSIIDEFEKYHSKIVSLEDANLCYDNNVKNLKNNRNKLLQSKRESLLALRAKEEETEVFLKEYEKLEGRYKYTRSVVEELRDENAHMNVDIVRLNKEKEEHLRVIASLKQELEASKEKEVKEPQNVMELVSELKNLKTQLMASKKELLLLNKVNAENELLKQRYQEHISQKLQTNANTQKLKEKYVRMQKDRDNMHEKIKHLEFEYNGLNKLYQSAQHEKAQLKKKAEDLILEKYNKMYETKHLFGIDVDSIRGQSNYVDIDSLIDGIDSNPPIQKKALA